MPSMTSIEPIIKIIEKWTSVSEKLVIIGTVEFRAITHEYFTDDSEYTVVAFTIAHQYRKKKLRGFLLLTLKHWKDVLRRK